MNFEKELRKLVIQYPCAITHDPIRYDGSPKKDFFQWLVARIAQLNKENEAMKRLISLYKLQDKKRDEQLKERFNRMPFRNNVKIDVVK